MTTRPAARALALTVLALSAQACLFLNDPGATTNNANNTSTNNATNNATNNTSNNPVGPNNPTVECDADCPPGTECDPVADACVPIACASQDECPQGTSCYLDEEGVGFCDPSCADDDDCFDGEICADGLCVFDGEPTCFLKPGVPSNDPDCAVFVCDFEDPDPSECDLGTDQAVACHFDANAPPGEDPGYCFELCSGDNECVPGARCGVDGVCAPAEDTGCDSWETTINGMCVPRACDGPGTPEGDRQCQGTDPDAKVFCVDAPRDNLDGVCWPDCTTLGAGVDACPGLANLTCNRDTGRCERR
jgi:hypothetical protein